jgi:hypothetical protein
MPQIILDSTQAQIVIHARDPIRVCDANGNLLGVLAPAESDKPKETSSGRDFSDEEIEAAKRSRDTPGPRSTTQEVLARLRAMRPEHG